MGAPFNVQVGKSGGFNPNQIHVSRPLTDFVQGEIPDLGIYDISNQLASVTNVSKQTDQYYIWEANQFLRDAADTMAPCSIIKTCSLDLGLEDYKVQPYAKGFDIPWEDLANQDEALDIELAALTQLRLAGVIRRELDFAEKFFQPGVWANELTGVIPDNTNGNVECVLDPDTQIVFFDSKDADPIPGIQRCKSFIGKTGLMANTLLLGEEAFMGLAQNPFVRARLSDNVDQIVTEDFLSRILGLRVIVGRAVYAPAGQESCYIYGPHALLVHVPSTASRITPSAIKSFRWTGFGAQFGAPGMDPIVADYEVRERRCQRYEMYLQISHKKTSDRLGCFFANVLQNPLTP